MAEEMKTMEPSGTSTDQVLPDDMQEIESSIRDTTIVQARAALLTLVGALEAPATAPRALHLIVEVAKTYLKMLASLGMPGVRAGSPRLGDYQIVDDEGTGGLGSVAEMSPGGETFAGQALQQILALAKNHILPKPDKPTPDAEAILGRPVPRVDNSLAIESLTRALATAKSAGLSGQVVEKLRKRLEEALDAQEKLVLVPEGPGESEEPSDEERAALGTAFLGGVAAGITGGE